jgi:hypothetical protein
MSCDRAYNIWTTFLNGLYRVFGRAMFKYNLQRWEF